MIFTLGFVQKRMVREKHILIKVLAAIAVISFLLSALAFVGNMSGEAGLEELTSSEEISRFYFSYRSAFLQFETAMYLRGGQLTIEVTQTDGWGVTTRHDRRYSAYLLKRDDFLVLFFAQPGRDIDFSENIVYVRNDYMHLRRGIVDDYRHIIAGAAPADMPVYVFFASSPRGAGAGPGVYFILITLLSFVIMMFCIYSKAIQKRSRLGKKIRESGDYDELMETLNQQAEEPVFTSYGLVLLSDFCLIFREKAPEIIPRERITSITSKPHIEYPEEIIEIELKYDSGVYDFTVFDKETESLVVGYAS